MYLQQIIIRAWFNRFYLPKRKKERERKKEQQLSAVETSKM